MKIYDLQSLNRFQDCNLKIGILGGSFYPAHQGHLKLSLQALNLFGFDYIIWLIALQNPLKTSYKIDIFVRSSLAARLVTHPRIIISTAEYDLKIKYSYQIIKLLTTKFQNINFTWLMGADVMRSFHKWQYYRVIPKLCDIIVFDRKGASSLFNFSKFTSVFAEDNIRLHKGIRTDISSTQIRSPENTIKNIIP